MTAARVTTVQNVLEAPGSGKPIAGRTITVTLNVPGFVDGGTTEKQRSRYATTDATGAWSLDLEVNADIDPAGTFYTVQEWGVTWTIVVPASAGPVNLRDCLVTNPANSSPVQAGIAAPASAATDGQLLAWSATLGEWTPVAPAGAAEIAAAKNLTGTGQPLAGIAGTISALVNITGTGIVVPASAGRPVSLHYGAAFVQSVAGDGSLYLDIQESTAGDVTLGGRAVRLPNSAAAELSSFSVDGEYPLGVVTTPRTFRLLAFLWCPAANAPSVTIANSATTPSFLRAVAG